MLSSYRLSDVYVKPEKEVVMVYSLDSETRTVTIPLSEAYKLKQHLIEIL